MRFCPRCGKQNIKGDYCSVCTLIVNPLPEGWKQLEITFCSRCTAHFSKNKWSQSETIEGVITKQFVKRLKLGDDVTVTPILDDLKTGPGVTQQVEIEVKAPRHGLYAVPMTVIFTICPKCSKYGTEYFEGVLQLRSSEEDIIRKDVIEAVRNEIAKYASRGVLCTKEGKVPGGVDFQITSQKHIQTIGRRLHERFGGTLKINSQLFSRSRETSRDLFRVNVLLDLPRFVKGDVVRVNQPNRSGYALVRISSIGKKIIGDDLIHKKGVTIDYHKADVEILPSKKTTISQVYPRIEVLDPNAYQSVPVENPGEKKQVKQGDNVRIVEDEGKYWVV